MTRTQKKSSFLLIRNIIWATIIFVLCTIPGNDIPDPQLNIPHMDKIVHAGLFFIMALLLCNELEYQTRLTSRKIYIVSTFIILAYGGLLELLQHYCFHRTGDLFDLLADVAGGVLGCILYQTVKDLKHRLFKEKD